MASASNTAGWIVGAFIWLPIVATLLVVVTPEASGPSFVRGFLGGFVTMPAAIGVIGFFAWLFR